MDINSKKWYFDTRKDFFKQIMIYFQWNSSSVMNIDIQNQNIGKNYKKIGKKFKINVLVPFPLICPNSYLYICIYGNKPNFFWQMQMQSSKQI